DLVISGSAANLTWRGDGSVNTWDAATTSNWINSGLPDVFYNNDLVTFDDTGSNSPAINVSGSLISGGVTVNATQNYTLAGTGDITAPSLTKNNSGTLVVDDTGTYGSTTIGNGTLQVGNSDANGTFVPGNIANSGT